MSRCGEIVADMGMAAIICCASPFVGLVGVVKKTADIGKDAFRSCYYHEKPSRSQRRRNQNDLKTYAQFALPVIGPLLVFSGKNCVTRWIDGPVRRFGAMQ